MGEQQQTLSDLSSKYTMLFVIALVSTILFHFMILLVNVYLRSNFMVIDLCINLWCVYLQFAFAKDHYVKCCGYCDARCRNYNSRRTRKTIHKLSMELSIDKSTSEGR